MYVQLYAPVHLSHTPYVKYKVIVFYIPFHFSLIVSFPPCMAILDLHFVFEFRGLRGPLKARPLVLQCIPQSSDFSFSCMVTRAA